RMAAIALRAFPSLSANSAAVAPLIQACQLSWVSVSSLAMASPSVLILRFKALWAMAVPAARAVSIRAIVAARAAVKSLRMAAIALRAFPSLSANSAAVAPLIQACQLSWVSVSSLAMASPSVLILRFKALWAMAVPAARAVSIRAIVAARAAVKSLRMAAIAFRAFPSLSANSAAVAPLIQACQL